MTTTRWMCSTLMRQADSLRTELERSRSGVLVCHAMEPGSPANPHCSAIGWARYYAALRIERAELSAERFAAAREELASLRRLASILADEPIAVDNLDRIHVYPKSLGALEFIQACGQHIYYLIEIQPDTLGDWVAQRQRWLCEMIAWISTDPSASMPFARDRIVTPAPPADIKLLSPSDIAMISKALATLHETRSQFLTSLTPPDPLQSDATGDPRRAAENRELLLAQLSVELNATEQELRDHHSFLSLHALALVAGEASKTFSVEASFNG